MTGQMSIYNRNSVQVLFSSWMAVFALFGVRATFAVLKDPIAAASGWSQTQVSFGYSLMMLSYALTAFVSGYLLDRYGPKIVYGIAAVFGFFGLLLTALLEGYAAYVVFFGIVTGIATGMLWVAATVTVRTWFTGNTYARSWGLAFCGAPISQFALAFLMRHLLARGTWNTAMIFLAGIVGAALAAAWFFSKHAPEHYGISAAGSQYALSPSSGEGDWGVKQAFTAMTIWVVILLFLTSMMGEFLIWTQIVSFWTEDLAWSRDAAVSAYSVIGITGIIAMPLAGRISDSLVRTMGSELHARKIMLAAGPLIGAAACGGLLLSGHAAAPSYAAAVLFAVYWAIVPGGVVGYAGAYFGKKSLGKIWGIATMIVMGIGPFTGTYVGAYLRDVSGSYYWSIVFALGAFLVSCVSAMLLPKRPSVRKH